MNNEDVRAYEANFYWRCKCNYENNSFWYYEGNSSYIFTCDGCGEKTKVLPPLEGVKEGKCMLDYKFTKDLENLINRHNIESGSNTPDYMLAEYLTRCIDNYNQICRQRDEWYKVNLAPGNSYFLKEDKECQKDIGDKIKDE